MLITFSILFLYLKAYNYLKLCTDIHGEVKFSLLYFLNYSHWHVYTTWFTHFHGSQGESLVPRLFSGHWVIRLVHLTLALLCWHPLPFLWSALILGEGAQKSREFSCTSCRDSNFPDKTTVFSELLCCQIPKKHWCVLLLRAIYLRFTT